MDNSVPVVVVYRGGNGALAIARTLGRLGVRVYLVSNKEECPVWTSRYWTKRFWWDFAAPAADSVQFLASIARGFAVRPILLTLADWAAIFIEDNADALEQHFVFPRASAPIVRKLANKWQTFLLAKEHRIPTPETAYPLSRDDVVRFAEATGYPIVVKTADMFLPGTSKEIVDNFRDLLDKYDRAAACGPPNLILQQYIPGNAESVWMCNAYFGAGSHCHAIFTGQKLRQVSVTGIASLAICLPNKTVMDTTRQFMQVLGYQGAVGVGYRYDQRDGSYKMLDVNPRISGVFRLFRATNALDIVRICYLDLTGQPIPESTASMGRKWMLEDDVFSALSSAREGKLTFRQWLKSLRGIRETHWFAADDPAPGFVWLWRTVWPRVASRMRRTVFAKSTP